MRTNIYLVRHAESPFRYGEERERGISEAGAQAAKRVADLLRMEGIDVVVTSPYARALLTVQPLAEQLKLPIHSYEGLHERFVEGDHQVSWEAKKQAVKKSFEDPDYAMDGGESTREAQQRVIPILMDLLDTYHGKRIVIGTHGNIMTVMMNYYDQSYGYDFWEQTTMPDIYRMTFEGNQLLQIVRLWN
ncbi:histidine phosphatase family protein [Paenibacillus guangzhouensis]|uniref:histidine phosphatase family protein n=1 Tax=Paenibacillus guangzhouensis TaxID=1473112 RepID=UPI001D10CB66|nr:histidine phosphatase family protein [Paenibacillus guangzhouensis]